MKKTRLAIVGLGRLGRNCAEAILADPACELAGVVRRPEGAPAPWLKAPAVSHIAELDGVDAALVCVPVDRVRDVAQALLQRRVPVVECARLHGDAFVAHKAELNRLALNYRAHAVVGAGCDPGILSLFRSQFALLVPHGHTQASLHTGASLHHSLAAAGVAGVRNALATEQRTAAGATQRYVYVELEPAADPVAVAAAIAGDPLFLDAETLVFPVASLADLEQVNRGVLLERHAAPGAPGHAHFLLEARYAEAELAAQVMLAAARALPLLKHGAHSLLDLPPGALWGERRSAAENEWI
jgi:diaminopimelate dehydrogenase